ncbi:MAG: aminopeptidase [Thermoplasmata archaeon]
MENKSGWYGLDENKIKAISDFAEKYRKFLSEVKTEREAVEFFENNAKFYGFEEYVPSYKGKRFYIKKNNKAIAFVNISGKVEEGFRIIAAHIDSPRLDLKPYPLVEDKDTETILFKTHYYGGIKKYQWVSRPLALRGVVVKKDGTTIKINIGDSENDPVFTIPDLLPHLARKVQGEKKLLEGFEGEDMQIIISHIPDKNDEKNPLKTFILNLLKEKYNIDENDLYSSDIEVVPAGQAKDVGMDKSMIGGYGQDDRICAFTSFFGMMDSNKKTNEIVILLDREEVGSDGNTGAQSNFIEYVVTKALDASGISYTYSLYLDILHRSKVISADVNAVVNPLFKGVHDMLNAAKAGHGVIVTKYTGSGGKYSTSEARAELVAEIISVFDKHSIKYQFGLLGKVDEGGGGTVAKYFAKYGMEVIDIGPGLMSMHSPFEIVSKFDLYSAYEAYRAFLEG